MKYIINSLCIIFALCISTAVFAQSEVQDKAQFKRYLKGSHNVDLGIGLANVESTVVDIIGFGQSFTAQPTPAINLQYEYGLNENIGIGGYFDYYRVNADINIPPLDNILSDPLCAATCALGINTPDCNCSGIDYTERTNVLTIAGKIAYHSEFIAGLDTYTSIIAGYSFNRRQSIEEILIQQVLRETNVANNLPTFIYKVSVGGKFYFSPDWGMYGEFGWANTHLIRFGITRRFL